MASAILQILPKLNNQDVKVYNYSNEGVASWYDFAREIIRIAKLNCQVNSIETIDYPTLSTCPYYSVLNKNKIKLDFDITI